MKRRNVFLLASFFVLYTGCRNEQSNAPCGCISSDAALPYAEVGDFSEGLAVVRKVDGNYAIIDSTGTVRYTTPYTFYLYSGFDWGDYGDDFHDGVIVCHIGDKVKDYGRMLYGIMDRTGKTVLAPSFAYIGPFVDGRALAQPTRNGKYGFLDVAGNWAVQPVYSEAWDFSEGYARVANDSARIGFIDRSGSLVIPAVYRDGGWFSEGLVAVRSFDGTWDYIDASGRVVMNMDSLGTQAWCERFSEGLAPVRRDDQSHWDFIDRSGRTVIERVAYQVGLFHDGITSARWLGSPYIRFIDRTGAVLFSFDDGGDFVNGYADVGMKCACAGADISFGAIDRTGKVVLPMKYSEVGSYSGGFFAIKAGGRAGHIDLRGVVLGTKH